MSFTVWKWPFYQLQNNYCGDWVSVGAAGVTRGTRFGAVARLIVSRVHWLCAPSVDGGLQRGGLGTSSDQSGGINTRSFLGKPVTRAGVLVGGEVSFAWFWRR